MPLLRSPRGEWRKGDVFVYVWVDWYLSVDDERLRERAEIYVQLLIGEFLSYEGEDALFKGFLNTKTWNGLVFSKGMGVGHSDTIIADGEMPCLMQVHHDEILGRVLGQIDLSDAYQTRAFLKKVAAQCRDFLADCAATGVTL